MDKLNMSLVRSRPGLQAQITRGDLSKLPEKVLQFGEGNLCTAS